MSTTPLIRVLVIDDYEPWHRSVVSGLRSYPEVEVIGVAHDGLEGVQRARELQPDLILLDVGLPGINGIEVARKITERAGGPKILFVSENRNRDVIEAALKAGGSGYLLKAEAGTQLFEAMKAVVAGRRFVSASLAGHFLLATNVSVAHTQISSLLLMILGSY